MDELTSQYICGGNGDAYDVMAVTPANGADFWYEAFSSSTNDAGVRVNGQTALGNAHVWKALNVLASDFGQLPVKLFRKQGGRSVEVEGIPEIDCLRIQPNNWMVPSVYKETSMWVAALWGNSITWVHRPTPRSIQLIPLRPDRVKITLVDDLKGEFYFVYTTDTGAKITLGREEVIHIPGLSTNGIWGMSLLEVARNVIGGGLALEKHQNRSFANGARPSGVLSHPGKPSPDARGNIRREWDAVHRGSDNAGKVAVLWEGMKYEVTAMTMETAQVAELRRLDREFVAELFNLPLFKLNSLEHSSTRSNLEQQNQEYVQGSLMRWIVRHTEEWGRKLLNPIQRAEGYYYKVIVEALLRGDTQARYSAYGVAIQNRIMNPNEAREKEDMEPYDGGDEFGNPNIDPKAANDANNQGGRPPGASSADNVIAKRQRELITAECNAIHKAAKEAKNFVAWIDRYYGDDGGFWSLVEASFAELTAFIAEAIPGHEFDYQQWSQSHAAESKRRLFKVCDQTTHDRLVESIKEDCDTW